MINGNAIAPQFHALLAVMWEHVLLVLRCLNREQLALIPGLYGTLKCTV